jgi:ABC-type uncharacterized transport system involved in gliding motility auxiliary subunit
MAKSKRVTNFAQAALYTVVVIAILVAVNYLSNRYNKSFDTTSNKRYTLSDQTQKVASGLAQDVTISYWNRAEDFQQAHDLLDRYENLSPKVKVRYEDIDKNRTAAIAAGVDARGTIFVQSGTRKETAKSLTEEEITGAMIRAIKGGDRMVCFTGGYGEGDPGGADANGYADVNKLIEKNNYKTQTLQLVTSPTVPKECTVLVVGGPRRAYLQPAVDAIKTYVEGGGHALILLDPPLKLGGSPIDENPGLEGLLTSWGVQMNKDLVLDLSGVGQLFGMGPEMPVVTSFEDHPITRQFKNMATSFPLTRSITIAPAGDKGEAKPLFSSSKNAAATTNLSSEEVDIDKAQRGSRVLAATAELKSEGSNKPRIIVLGTSRWIANQFLGVTGNRDLLLNMLNWLSADEDLISIRPKDPEDRRLNMNARQVSLMFWGSAVFIPALMFLAGVSVWWKRR